MVESYCVLTEGAGGRWVTQPLRRSIKNRHHPVSTPYGVAYGTAENTRDSIDTAADSRPPWKRTTSDEDRKPPPPGAHIIRDMRDLEKAGWEGGKEIGRDVRQTTREQSERVRDAASRTADKASHAGDPIAREAEEIRKASKESGDAANRRLLRAADRIEKA